MPANCHCAHCEHRRNKHVIETADTTVTVETHDRDIMPPSEMPITYTVVPYDYSHMAGRKGVVYQIVEQHFLANAKTLGAAQHIVDKLNSLRRLERELERSEARMLRLRADVTTSGSVREAMVKELASIGDARLGGRWSSSRKLVTDFGKNVLKRLGIDDPCGII